ncbi:Nramp family divalent metal transporter [Pseudidiomarina sp.]|uniref:Nramp family divalent metal transporter n=1 Tax=Pseudidiomarina sp. TaxID=2081707 RepID=UPI00299EEF2F|nr:Nramp family divalent metal transporter [Pseudidiomarina sp.]MDX1705368.1 Nramp family divalent metal transporter [Pseudidiomarina sp.]
MSQQNRYSIGPAALVAAAFIGPGTVVTASLAGAHFGYVLLWALVFSVLATMVLQEMAARLGVVTQQGLGENIRAAITHPVLRWLAVALVLAAIVIGNSVYQGGNLTGASLGLNDLIGSSQIRGLTPLALGIIAGIILWIGSYRLIERVLIGLVVLMSIAFVVTFMLTRPDWGPLLTGLLIPSLPVGSVLTVVALIGTTVVPYNLFLHASSAAQRWQSADQLPAARRDLLIAIPIGGLISVAIVATAASAFFGRAVSLQGAADLGQSLQPLFGDAATWFMATGLFAAGISSALTAPLASAYALSGVLGYPRDLTSWPFRLTWLAILIIGISIASLGIRPVSVIWFAQVANGLLLPVIALFLLWVCNQPRLGSFRNSAGQNLLGGTVCLIAVGLGMRSLASAFGWLG